MQPVRGKLLMGKGKREKPARLAAKLVKIRKAFGLSQNEMLRHLGLSDKLTREEVSAYERGVREPSLLTLLKYAEAAGVWVDVLINDDLDLPAKLPCAPKHEGINRASAARRKKRGEPQK
jgi:transcriptional regulator with XRE-family HTH domain